MKRILTLIAVAIIATTNICSAQGGLNEIRFRGWDDKDWFDNDYIRELRSYLDAYCRGEVECPSLDKYSDIVDSQFIIAGIEPSYFGGVSVAIIFLDDPTKAFSSHVYSYVDEEKKIVTDYEVWGIELSADNLTITREDILRIDEEEQDEKVLW
ncbi:MAG: hypothetical protein IKK89_05375 [Alistipes sp.]|nr:hypothetical protein [Alistipes sp.]